MRISDWSSDVCSSDLLGDLDLLVLGIAFEPDDLHAVEQRLRQVERVRGGDEHDVAEVDVDLQIMVLELAILFGVENLEQRRGRIASEILAELVDLVEREKRVNRAGLFEVSHHLARQRAAVSYAVAADVSLGSHATPRQAKKNGR